MLDPAIKASGWFFAAVVALLGVAYAADAGFAVHMGIVCLAALIAAVWTMVGADHSALAGLTPHRIARQDIYDDEVIRWGLIATMF